MNSLDFKKTCSQRKTVKLKHCPAIHHAGAEGERRYSCY
jgi:hypothetical protein